MVVLGAVPDPYGSAELRLRLTRSVLETILAQDLPLVVMTRSEHISRDVDLLWRLAQQGRVRVFIGLATLDLRLSKELEPGASTPQQRLDALNAMARAGLHAGVLLGPVIPGLNATEIETILEAAAHSGAGYADYCLLQMRENNRAAATQWLQAHCPQRSGMVLQMLRGASVLDDMAAQVAERFENACHRFLLEHVQAPLGCSEFSFPAQSH